MYTRSTRSRCRRLRISSQSRHSARTVLTKRSAIAFAFGARSGVLTIRMPSLRKTSLKGPLYLLSRFTNQEADAVVREVEAKVARLLRDPDAGGIGRTAGEPDALLACAMKNNT